MSCMNVFIFLILFIPFTIAFVGILVEANLSKQDENCEENEQDNHEVLNVHCGLLRGNNDAHRGNTHCRQNMDNDRCTKEEATAVVRVKYERIYCPQCEEWLNNCGCEARYNFCPHCTQKLSW